MRGQLIRKNSEIGKPYKKVYIAKNPSIKLSLEGRQNKNVPKTRNRNKQTTTTTTRLKKGRKKKQTNKQKNTE